MDEEEEDDSEISGYGGVPFCSEVSWPWARAQWGTVFLMPEHCCFRTVL